MPSAAQPFVRAGVYGLNFDNTSLFTFPSHIWDCDALSWLHKYTLSVWFKWRGKVKACLPRRRRDPVKQRRTYTMRSVTRCQYGKDWAPLPLCSKLPSLHPRITARTGLLMCASSLVLTCLYEGKNRVYQLCVNLWIYVCAHVITYFPIFLKLWYCFKLVKFMHACCSHAHTHTKTRWISTTGHLTGHPIKAATISPTPCTGFFSLNLTRLS